MSFNTRSNRGITLIELVVTIAVIALVAAVTYPVISNTLDAAQSTATSSQQRIVDSFATDWTNGDYAVTQGSGAYDGYVIAYSDANANGTYDDGETIAGKVKGSLAPADAPTNVTASATNGSTVAVTWTAPAYSGSLKTTGYNVEYSTSSTFSENVNIVATTSDAPNATITGLTPGTTYYVKVAASSSAGTGAESQTATVTTPRTPGTPTALQVAPMSGTTLTVSWSAPANDGGSVITGYRVELSTTPDFSLDAQIVDTNASTTTWTFTGLTPGTTYYSRVSATNALGTSAATTTSFASTPTVSSVPTGLSATVVSATSLKIDWNAPTDDGGTPVTGYRVTYSTTSNFSTGTTVVDTALTSDLTLTGLSAGTVYYLKVAATNTVGTGAFTSPITKTPAGTPASADAPLAALTGLSTATLTWTAPNNGGSTITGYTVTASPAGPTATVTGTTATISGLVAGTDYTFTVTAVNAYGTGAASPASNTITAATTPGAPTGLGATIASSTSLNLAWTAPAVDGGDTITSYRLTYSTSADFTTGTHVVDTGSTATTQTLSGLVAGTTYYLKVAATNGVGTGTASSAASKAPAGIPAAPSAPTATLTGLTTATLDWNAPATNGSAITGYQISASPTGPTATITGTTATITGLAAGTDYTFTVRAINALGRSAYSAASNTITSATVPGAPTSLGLTIASATSLTAHWTAPSVDGGDTVTSYRVMYSTAADFAANVTIIDTGSTATTKTLTGLTPGATYYVKVSATNNVGTGAASDAGVKAPSAAPAAPAAPTATLTGLTTATLDWAAPATNGSAITGYTVTASPAGPTVTITGTAATVTGLAAGTDYTFTVKATNAQGTSPASPASNTITSAATPGAPSSLAVTIASATSLSADWTAPTVDGGDTVTGYRVTYSTSASFASNVTVVDTGSTATSKTLTGLTPGATYYVKVAATNNVGTGTATAPVSETPAAAPAAPAAPTATLTGLATASLDWTAPAANGSTITGYTVTSSPAGPVATVTGTAATITGLSAGTDYTFTVTATNAKGTSATSARSNTITAASAPSVPTGLALAIASGTSLNATWTAPAVDGGDAITSYRVTYSTASDFSTGVSVLDTGSANPATTLTGLTNGTAYYVKVAATNGVGTSSYTAAAVKTPATAPAAPAAPTATLTGLTTASLTWTAPATNGSPITAFTVTSTPAGPTVNVTGVTAAISGLIAGTDYTFTVKATNAQGTSAASPASNTITAAAAPDAPTALAATIASSSSLHLSWTAPANVNGSALTSYRVTYSTSASFFTGTNVFDTGTTATTASITGLSAGTTYYVKVAATNSVGTGTTTGSVSQAPMAVPAAPGAPVAAITGLTTASLDWTAPASNGSPVTSYVVTSSPAGPVASISGTSATLSGLSAGTDYTFTVKAVNAMGASNASPASNTVTSATTPNSPTGFALAIASSTSLTASWTAPAVDGGDPITSYRVTYSTSADFTTGTAVIDTGLTATTKTITGLTPGTLYYVHVAATNGVGTGSASTSDSKTPAAVPGAPATPVAVLTGLTTASLNWSAPAANGSTITGYTVTSSPAGAVSTIIGTSAVMSDLVAGTSYTFTVKAINAMGASAASPASNQVTAATTPNAPTGLSIAITSSTTMTASWTAPTVDGGDPIFSYRTTYSTTPDFSSNVQTLDSGMTQTSQSLIALTPGTTYYVKVAATNSVGTGAYSTASNKAPADVPTAPDAPTATLTGLTTGTLSWTAPSGNGSIITSYSVTASPAGPTVTTNGAATTATITGMTAGTTYTFTVKATNAIGSSTMSSASNAITAATTPGAPTGLGISVASSTSLAVSWTAPTSTGGDAITSYRVTYSTASDFAGSVLVVDTGDTAPAKLLTGLTPGTLYYIKVAATNGVGTGTYSTASVKAPMAVPAAPAAPAATLTGLTTATLSWTAPSGNGSAVTGYTITSSPAGAVAVITGTTATISGLVAGNDYTFTVAAINSVGTGLASPASNKITTATTPNAPTGMTATIASSTSLTASWTAPAVTGGDAITSYRVTYSTSSDFSTGVTVIDTGLTATSKTLTGLSAGTTYYLKVAATNGVGTGTASASTNAAPMDVPSAPAAPTATLTGLTTASLTWTAPAANGSPIAGYLVTSSPAGATAVVTGTTAAISGLTAGTSYTFTVKAANAMGTGAASPASNQITAATTPGAPTGMSLSIASGTSLTASWTAPAATGGDAITSYRVTYSTSSDFSTGTSIIDTGSTALSKTITGLTTGTTYYVKVAATNGVGTGAASSSFSLAPATAPSTPAAPTATLTGLTTATLSWTAPAANGAPITGYTITSSPAGAVAVITGTTATLSGLTSGTSYTFAVAATNGVGTSSASTASNSILTATTPGAPTGLSLSIASATSLTASWTAPASTGGTALTSYRVTYSTSADFSTGTTVVDTGSTALTTTITGLTAGTVYYVKVAATNAVGTGSYTASSSQTPNAVTSAPAAPTVAGTLDAQTAALTWTAPANTGTPITSYTLQYTTDSTFATGVTSVPSISGTTYTATLPTTSTYYFRVAALNASGTSAYSSGTTATWTYQNQTSAITSYTCTSGDSLSGTTCTNTYQYVSSYTCPSGGSLSGSTCTQTVLNQANYYMNYSCPSTYNGWPLTSGPTTLYHQCNYDSSYSATAAQSCSAGSIFNNQCVYAASGGNTTYTCVSHTSTNGGTAAKTCSTTLGAYNVGTIAKGGTYWTSTSQVQPYTCPSGGSLSGSTCYLSITYTYSCPNGGSLSGTTCVSTSTNIANNSGPLCSTGTLNTSNYMCEWYTYPTYVATPQYSQGTTTYAATPVYTYTNHYKFT